MDEIQIKEGTAADRAADKLQKEADAVRKTGGVGFPIIVIRAMVGDVCRMLTRFCYQDERFAQAVLDRKEKLYDCMSTIVKMSSRERPVISDLDTYAEAVRFYIPEGQVTMTCRVVIKAERDDDLFDLGVEDETDGEAVILELPLLE
jgi:hypothetical protein